jgi:hypothetical protein
LKVCTPISADQDDANNEDEGLSCRQFYGVSSDLVTRPSQSVGNAQFLKNQSTDQHDATDDDHDGEEITNPIRYTTQCNI